MRMRVVLSCFLDAAGSFLHVVAPKQQGCRVLHISKHERLGKSESKKGRVCERRQPNTAFHNCGGLETGHFDISSADRDRH